MNLLVDYLEPKDFDNGSHDTNLFAGCNFPENLPKELEDVNEGDENIGTDTSDDEPHKINCTLDDERTYMTSSDDADEENNPPYKKPKMQVDEWGLFVEELQ